MLRRDILLTIDLQQKHRPVDFESKPWERLQNTTSNCKYKLIELDQYYNIMVISYGLFSNVENVQWTIRVMRLLTVGGTPLEAMQRYEPMCCLVTRWKVSVELSTTATVQTIGEINMQRLLVRSDKSFNCFIDTI